MGISLNPKHLKLYGELAVLFLRYGNSDVVRTMGLEEALPQTEGDAIPGALPEAEALAADLERLGPTFVKLGQLLSTRPDLLPAPYIDALSRLQDRLEPFPFAEVKEIVESELAVPINKVFSEFGEVPIAAASLGQAHLAALRDGRRVVVKVQRPGIRQRIIDELDALEEVAEFAERRTEAGKRYGVLGMIREFRRNIMSELDYLREASNLATLSCNLAGFDRLVVPEPVEQLSSPRVLTMEYVRGQKITQLGPLRRVELDGEVLADQLFAAYLKQVLVDGFFHADPHPGNVFLTDSDQVALLDLGMVGRVPPTLQDQLLRLMLAVSDGNGEEASRVALAMGTPLDGLFERDRFVQEIADLVSRFYAATSAQQLEMGRVVIEMSRIAAKSGVLLPSQISTLGRAFLALDQVGRTLFPDFDPNAAIRRHVTETMRQRMLRSLSPAAMFGNLLEANDFVQRLPGRLNQVMDAISENQVEVGIRLRQETWLMEGLQKISNRIAMGLVLAALIVGGALIMHLPTRFQIFGYPGLAMLLFGTAAVLGFWMVLTILLHDVRESRRRR